MEVVNVQLRRDLFEGLKHLAEPLVDDVNTVIQRLLAHWEEHTPEPGARFVKIPPPPIATVWRTARGDSLPIGTKLVANYLSRKFDAIVTVDGIDFQGKIYDNPSAAGIAAKACAGTSGPSGNTNGWTFWEYYNPESKRWQPIDRLRKSAV